MTLAKTLTRLGLTLTIGGTMVLNAGCWELALAIGLSDDGSSEPSTAPPPTDPYSDPYTEGAIDFRAETLSGDLGAVRGFEGNIWQESGYEYGDVASIQVDSRNRDEGWAVMAALTVEGGLDHPDLVPGAVFTFRGDDYGYGYDAERLYVSLLGCSGPADAYWEFDQTADEVTLQVQEGSTPDHRRIAYTGTWSDGSTVSGTLEYRAY